MDGQDAIVFFVLNKETQIWGYSWLIEWSTTSFYIKSQLPTLQSMKVSLHGPDPNHSGKQHLRFDFAHPDQVEKAVKAGGGWSTDLSDGPPFNFSGRQVNDHAAHIVRFSSEWDMFSSGMPPAPGGPKHKQKATLHARVPAPPKGQVTHVTSISAWGTRTGRTNSRRGRKTPAWEPISNDAGMNLTAVVTLRSITSEPDPHGDVRGTIPLDQCARGMAAAVDETALLWLCEKMIAVKMLGYNTAKISRAPGGSSRVVSKPSPSARSHTRSHDAHIRDRGHPRLPASAGLLAGL
jgi:hypothetical protein